jgi:mannose-6-phosphate isomerase
MTGSGNAEQQLDLNPRISSKSSGALLTKHSLPLWSGEGWDPVAGGFVEKLDTEGRADRAAPRRVRVQARQIYCFAKAADLGWYPQGRWQAFRRSSPPIFCAPKAIKRQLKRLSPYPQWNVE